MPFDRLANCRMKCFLGAAKQQIFAYLVFYRSECISQGAVITVKTPTGLAFQYVCCESQCKLRFLEQTCRRAEDLGFCRTGCHSNMIIDPQAPAPPKRFPMCFANPTANPSSSGGIAEVSKTTVFAPQNGPPSTHPKRLRKSSETYFWEGVPSVLHTLIFDLILA